MTEDLQPERHTTPGAANALLFIFSWLWVGVPLAWGVLETVRTSLALFR
jgi:hypothetical protein